MFEEAPGPWRVRLHPASKPTSQPARVLDEESLALGQIAAVPVARVSALLCTCSPKGRGHHRHRVASQKRGPEFRKPQSFLMGHTPACPACAMEGSVVPQTAHGSAVLCSRSQPSLFAVQTFQKRPPRTKRRQCACCTDVKEHEIRAAVYQQRWAGDSGRARGTEGRAEEEEGRERTEGTPLLPPSRSSQLWCSALAGSRCSTGFL